MTTQEYQRHYSSASPATQAALAELDPADRLRLDAALEAQRIALGESGIVECGDNYLTRAAYRATFEREFAARGHRARPLWEWMNSSLASPGPPGPIRAVRPGGRGGRKWNNKSCLARRIGQSSG